MGPCSQISEVANISYILSIKLIRYPNHQISEAEKSLLVDPAWALVGIVLQDEKLTLWILVPFNSPTEMTPWRVILGVNRVLCVKLQEFWNCSVLKHQNLFIRSLWVGMTRAWMKTHFAKIDSKLTLNSFNSALDWTIFCKTI